MIEKFLFGGICNLTAQLFDETFYEMLELVDERIAEIGQGNLNHEEYMKLRDMQHEAADAVRAARCEVGRAMEITYREVFHV